MRHKLLSNEAGLRTFAVIFGTGDDPVAGLKQFAREERVGAATFTAIGALSRATVAFFDWERKEYQHIPYDEQVEVLTLAGNVALKDDKPALHAHVVLGRRDGTACGGHLMEAVVRPTLEVIVIETPANLRRTFDSTTGLALIDLTASRARRAPRR